MSEPFFSIIIPIYNAEKTISNAIESVLCQSYSNFELILVNDGSNDNSLIICHDYEKKDSRVIVLDYPNGGVACARNRGLKTSKGNRICFLDADDIVLPEWLQKYSECSDADLMIEGHVSVTENGKILITDDDESFFEDKFIKGIEKVSRDGRLNMPWNKCYKRTIIEENNLMFLEGCDLFEDLIFSLQYIQKSHSLKLISYCGYEYLQYNSVLTRKFNNPEKFLMWLNRIVDETLTITNTYIGTSLINSVYKRLFNAATWYVVLFYSKLKYSERNRVYGFLSQNKKYLDAQDLQKNRILFMYVSKSNRLLDLLIGVESLLYLIKSRIRKS